MRAVYQLNEETLDTNLKVLKERQKVNTSYITMLSESIWRILESKVHSILKRISSLRKRTYS